MMVIALCGSTRFATEFQRVNQLLTLRGHLVINLVDEEHRNEEAPRNDGDLNELHVAKLDASDALYILDVGGYLGDSTWAKILYARCQGKPIWYWTELAE